MGRHRGIALDGVAEHALLPQPPGLALGFAALPEPTLARAVRALGRAVERREITAARARLDSMEPRVVANRTLRRYELWLGERLAGTLDYTRSDGVVALTHTEVEPDLRGQGHGERLVRDALADLREHGATVRPVCPFVVAYVRRHSEATGLG